MRIKIQATHDGNVHDWIKVFADGQLLVEGRDITVYEVLFELSERYPNSINLEPLIARGYVATAEYENVV